MASRHHAQLPTGWELILNFPFKNKNTGKIPLLQELDGPGSDQYLSWSGVQRLMDSLRDEMTMRETAMKKFFTEELAKKDDEIQEMKKEQLEKESYFTYEMKKLTTMVSRQGETLEEVTDKQIHGANASLIGNVFQERHNGTPTAIFSAYSQSGLSGLQP